jgi:hypothetical protein
MRNRFDLPATPDASSLWVVPQRVSTVYRSATDCTWDESIRRRIVQGLNLFITRNVSLNRLRRLIHNCLTVLEGRVRIDLFKIQIQVCAAEKVESNFFVRFKNIRTISNGFFYEIIKYCLLIY